MTKTTWENKGKIITKNTIEVVYREIGAFLSCAFQE